METIAKLQQSTRKPYHAPIKVKVIAGGEVMKYRRNNEDRQDGCHC